MKKDVDFSSEDILEKLRKRDSDIITKVVQTYTLDLLRAARGLGFDALNADEIVQSVWVTFFDVVKTFEGKSQVKTFLFGILYNKASEQRRENTKSMRNDPIEAIMEEKFDSTGHWKNPPVDPEKFSMSMQSLELIQQCIDTLPTAQRMAFCLKEIDQNSTTEICKILELSITNLGVVLFRAKNRLRECIESKTKKGKGNL
jgi:RNA polymerase sigma-70 factor (ECF subfamily)